LGAEPVVFSQRNECCGSYGSFEDKQAVKELSCKVLESAKGKGAEALVTACPLCRYNLTQEGLKEKMAVQYFTELLAEALGVK
jgi:heterodisulfide reductase subunit B